LFLARKKRPLKKKNLYKKAHKKVALLEVTSVSFKNTYNLYEYKSFGCHPITIWSIGIPLAIGGGGTKSIISI
jgi:hypothetical protein